MTHLLRLFLRSFIYFLLIHLTVFLAADLLLPDPARSFLGPNARQEEVETLRQEMGLDRSLPIRYFIQLARMTRLEFGESPYYQEDAGRVVFAHLGNTLPGVFAAQVGALGLGLLIGLTLWTRGNRLGLRVSKFGAFWAQAVPGFVFLVLLAAALRVWLGVTPLAYTNLFVILAAVVAAFFPIGAITNWTVGALDEAAKGEPFLLLSAGLGIPRGITSRRLMRLILPGGIGLSIHTFGITFTTYFFAEFIFNLKGFGNLLFLSVSRSDFPIIITGSLVSAVLVLGLQLVGDVLTISLDPRQRHGAF